MKREALIMAGVLVPFAVLVGLGFVFTRDEAPATPLPVPVNVPAPVPVTVTTPTPRPVAPAPVDAGALLKVAHLEETPVPPTLVAPLQAVRAEVRRCFVDASAHMHGEVKVTMRFQPTRDGGFARVQVQHTSYQDPFFTSCLEDVFQDLTFTPDGSEDFAPAEYTWVFDAAR